MKGVENWTWSTWATKEREKIDRAERSRPDVVPRGWTSLDIFSSCTTEVCKITYGVERRNGKRWLAAVCQCWEEPVRANTSLCTPQLPLCSACKCLPLAEMGCWGHRLLLRVRQKKYPYFLMGNKLSYYWPHWEESDSLPETAGNEGHVSVHTCTQEAAPLSLAAAAVLNALYLYKIKQLIKLLAGARSAQVAWVSDSQHASASGKAMCISTRCARLSVKPLGLPVPPTPPGGFGQGKTQELFRQFLLSPTGNLGCCFSLTPVHSKVDFLPSAGARPG